MTDHPTPAPPPAPEAAPVIRRELWEDTDYIITVSGKPCGQVQTARDADVVARWLRTAVDDLRSVISRAADAPPAGGDLSGLPKWVRYRLRTGEMSAATAEAYRKGTPTPATPAPPAGGDEADDEMLTPPPPKVSVTRRARLVRGGPIAVTPSFCEAAEGGVTAGGGEAVRAEVEREIVFGPQEKMPTPDTLKRVAAEILGDVEAAEFAEFWRGFEGSTHPPSAVARAAFNAGWRARAALAAPPSSARPDRPKWLPPGEVPGPITDADLREMEQSPLIRDVVPLVAEVRRLRVAPPAPARPSPDDPQWDDAEASSPTYLRGNNAGVASVVELLNKVLDGKDDGAVVIGYAPLEKLRRRLMTVRPALGPAEGRWIPVTERMPQGGTWVLIAKESTGTVFWATAVDGWFAEGPDDLLMPSSSVTHWRPLPPPPGVSAEAAAEGEVKE